MGWVRTLWSRRFCRIEGAWFASPQVYPGSPAAPAGRSDRVTNLAWRR